MSVYRNNILMKKLKQKDHRGYQDRTKLQAASHIEELHKEVEKLRVALSVASRALDIAADWNVDEVQAHPPKGWNLEAFGEDPGEGWCSTRLLAKKLNEMSEES